jgi:hypothetical protein
MYISISPIPLSPPRHFGHKPGSRFVFLCNGALLRTVEEPSGFGARDFADCNPAEALALALACAVSGDPEPMASHCPPLQADGHLSV